MINKRERLTRGIPVNNKLFPSTSDVSAKPDSPTLPARMSSDRSSTFTAANSKASYCCNQALIPLLWGGGAGMLGSAPDLECRTTKEEEEEQCS